MSWSHIVLEGVCLHDEDNDKLPNNCIYGSQNLSVSCLENDLGESEICHFLAYGRARTSKILTDSRGVVVDFDAFELLGTSEEEFLKKEKKWIKNSFFNKETDGTDL